MSVLTEFESKLTPAEYELWHSLGSPAAIQAFLDRTPYSIVDDNLSPLSVLRQGVAHCLDGGLFAAAALRRLGYPPLIIDLLPDPGQDDDHVLAIYKINGCYGCVAKSNYPGLRSREPIYRSLRELALSYFEWYFSFERKKTLRAYTRPLNLAMMDATGWMWRDSGADAIERRLWEQKPVALLNPGQAEILRPVDHLTHEAGTIGVNEAGVFRPGNKGR
ncbi:MAG: hypothetical protein J5I90_22940 [Caldilineales bacterium]|nr:hypothetical protein [Caldilineales bacterium]